MAALQIIQVKTPCMVDMGAYYTQLLPVATPSVRRSFLSQKTLPNASPRRGGDQNPSKSSSF